MFVKWTKERGFQRLVCGTVTIVTIVLLTIVKRQKNFLSRSMKWEVGIRDREEKDGSFYV